MVAKNLTVILMLIAIPTFANIVADDKAFSIYIDDPAGDSIQIDVNLQYNQQQPQFYYSHVETPVCKEGLCHILVVNLYWDLLGNFQKYELPPGRPLTKFDHEEFTKADYEKLDNILADKRSLLGEYAVEDLVDESTELVSKEVDAVTGATMKSVQNTVVSGAVYSTYALWHLVNGEIPQRIPTITESIWNNNLLNQFLDSDHYPYHYYALDRLSEDKFVRYLPEIIRLMNESSIFVSRYAINKFPTALCQDSVGQTALVQRFATTDFRTQEVILEKIRAVPLYEPSLALLVEHLDKLSEQQVHQILNMVLANADRLSNKILDPMVALLDHPNPVYAKLVWQTLQSLSQQYTQLTTIVQNYENTFSKY